MTDPSEDPPIQWDDLESRRKARKHQLFDKLTSALEENERLRGAVARLMQARPQPFPLAAPGYPGDCVPAGWADRHGIRIPRADGLYESERAWVLVKHAEITQAALKDMSILSRLITTEKLDPGSVEDAKTFADWRTAFLARLEGGTEGHCKDGPAVAWTKEDRYQKLNRPENANRVKWIVLACEPNPAAVNLQYALTHPQHYRSAFQWLHASIKQINKQASNAKKLSEVYAPLMQ